MNFVIVSSYFFPKSDAESFCTTRLASALVRAGHDVQVVTMNWKQEVSDAVINDLLDRRVRVFRANLPSKISRFDMLKYRLYSGDAVTIFGMIKLLKQVLINTDHAILISRTCPIASLIVAWQCQKFASKWIAHLSDPLPNMCRPNGIRQMLSCFLVERWIRRAMHTADVMSVTCPNAIRWYCERYGKDAQNAKWIVTTHIGDFSIGSNVERSGVAGGILSNLGSSCRVLLHPGTIQKSRNPEGVIKAVDDLNKEDFPIVFMQNGAVSYDVGENVLNSFSTNLNIIVEDTTDPVVNAVLTARANAVYVPDTDFGSDLTYSPFILSKFVYQLFSDKPIVLCTKKNSDMLKAVENDPDAGVFWAESGDVQALKNAIRCAVMLDPHRINRDRVRKRFLSSQIVADLTEGISHG